MNKGFTLVELLAVIVIIALITVVAVPNAFTFQKNMTNKMFCSKIKTIESAGRQYGNDIYNTLDSAPNKLASIVCSGHDRCVKISVGLLVNKKYLKEENEKENEIGFYDPRNFKNLAKENEVIVYIENRRVYAKFVFSKEKDLRLCYPIDETDASIDLYYKAGSDIYRIKNGVAAKW